MSVHGNCLSPDIDPALIPNQPAWREWYERMAPYLPKRRRRRKR